MKLYLLALIIFLVLPDNVIAASDGALSATESKGEFEIKLSVTDPQQIQIINMENVEFNLAPDDNPNAQSFTPCIYMSGPITTYDLQIAAEVLTDNSTMYPYSIKFLSSDQNGVTDEVNLAMSNTPGSASKNAIPAASSTTCLGNRTTEVSVTLDQTTSFAETSGQASAKITITVSPST